MKQKRKKLGRKLIGFLLTLGMVVGLMPGMGLTAYAAGTATEVSTADAFKSAIADEGEIKLTGDFDLPLDNALNINKAVIIDLNGHTINVKKGRMYCYWGIYAPVTIKDSASGGAIINPSDDSAFTVYLGGSLTLEGGTLESTGNGDGIDVFRGPFTMTGGVIKSNNDSIWRDGGKVTISGGTINGDFVGTDGEIDITGGSFSFDPSALLKEGYSASKVGDYWVVNAPVYYNVTLSGGANATTSGGATSQTGISGEMATVTYTANTGYYFAEFADTTDNGITAKRTSSTVVTVSGTPTADATITVPDAVEKTAATVTKAPTAKSLTYTGSAQELVTAGEATGGTMQYALGDANGATEPYATSIPTATEAGTYHVWYKAVGDADHADSEPACVDATIKGADPAPVVGTVEVYRTYNPKSGEHFYTASAEERDAIVALGWVDEGVGWVAPEASPTPVFRLYSGTDHHYTASAEERDKLVALGWVDEGVACYSDDGQGTPLYRLFNPNVDPHAANNNSGSHHFTTSKAECDHLAGLGWVDEGVAWHGVAQ